MDIKAFAPLDADKVTNVTNLAEILGFAEKFFIDGIKEEKITKTSESRYIEIPHGKEGYNVPSGWIIDEATPYEFKEAERKDIEQQKTELNDLIVKFSVLEKEIILNITDGLKKNQKLWSAWKTIVTIISEKTGISYKTVSCKGKLDHSPYGCRYAHSPPNKEDLTKVFESWLSTAKSILSDYQSAKDTNLAISKRLYTIKDAISKLEWLDNKIKSFPHQIKVEIDSMISELRCLEQNAKLYSVLHKGPTKWNIKSPFAPSEELVRPPIQFKKEDGRTVLLYAPPGKDISSCYHGSKCNSIIESGTCKHLHKKEHISKEKTEKTEKKISKEKIPKEKK